MCCFIFEITYILHDQYLWFHMLTVAMLYRSCKSYDFFAARYARQRSEINNVANGGQDEG